MNIINIQVPGTPGTVPLSTMNNIDHMGWKLPVSPCTRLNTEVIPHTGTK